ncbi:hypothetical protein [Lignipirellula cremea]|uniref:Uncharacterized protein n=1 Tax=Lignipirellula cremea TaxID=2528010 RepID=A0A518DWC4_9BACT|nr:hypothetical protein [Lignipirellula cremea]QDU96142.1 hypothetical protein Pla8534_39610 [Lignipirellula cremea]
MQRTSSRRLAGRPWATLLLAVVCVAVSGGCLELDTHIQLQTDGSAIITENLVFFRRLLDLDTGSDGGLRLADLLSKAAVERRMKNMGKGVKLISHEVRDGDQASRVSHAVFHVADLSQLRYVSPFLSYVDYPKNNAVKFEVEPVFEGTWWGRRAGDIAVAARPIEKPESAERLKEGEPVPPGPTPRELQTLRELQPVFRDMAKGMRIRLTFESYGPLRATGFGYRGRRAGAANAELIDFSDTDLDNFGGLFLENEEIMLELLRGDLGGPNLVENVEKFVSNVTTPVLLTHGSAHNKNNRDEIYLPPSKELFEKYFQGKMLTFYYEKGPDKTRPATFQEIGYQGPVKPVQK